MEHACAASPFETMYARRFSFVQRSLSRLGVPAGELPDAAQETFVAAYRHYEEFRPSGDERAWLYGIARRIAFRYRRGAARRSRFLASYRPMTTGPRAPDCAVAQRDAARLLQAFLDRLPEAKRDVFILARLEGMTGVEVSDALGLNANTMWTRLRTADQALERFVRRHGGRETIAALLHEEPVVPARRSRVWAVLLAKLKLGSGSLAVPVAATVVAILATTPATGTEGVGGVVGDAVGADVGVDAGVSVGAGVSLDMDVDVDVDANANADADADANVDLDVDVGKSESEPVGETASGSEAVSEGEPKASVGAGARTGARTEPEPEPGPSPTASVSGLSIEARLLRSARKHLKAGDAAAALGALEAHARSFPDGVLAAERKALVVRTLCRLGRDGQARRAARAVGGRLATVASDGCGALDENPKSGPRKPARPEKSTTWTG